jgi:hypothetical protein
MKLEMPLLGLLCSLLLASCSSNKLPKITDPEALRKDCVDLYLQYPSETKTNRLGREYVVSGGLVSKEKWTSAISALKPLQVMKDKYGIRIFIYATDERVRGYYVVSDPAPPPAALLSVKNTKTKGIYEFEEPEVKINNELE